MNNNDPCIVLYGIDGLYNYGCEAIVRGTETIVHRQWPNADIKYASVRPKDDKKRLKDCDVNVFKRKLLPYNSFSRINSTFGNYTGLYLKNFFHEDLLWVKNCDIIFSIGGDIYTLPPNKSSFFKYYYNPLVHFGETIKSMNKRFVIWGSSIGPYEKNLRAKKILINHFHNVDLITAREPKSTRYLKRMVLRKTLKSVQIPHFWFLQ